LIERIQTQVTFGVGEMKLLQILSVDEQSSGQVDGIIGACL